MNIRTSLVLLTWLQLLVSPAAVAAETPKSNEQLVRDYVSAFNQHELDTMLSMVSRDIQWLSVTGEKIPIETQGKVKLGERLTTYFKATPSAQSELQWVRLTASRVAAMEKATWQGKSSLSVYAFRAGLITRVYYYPAEK